MRSLDSQKYLQFTDYPNMEQSESLLIDRGDNVFALLHSVVKLAGDVVALGMHVSF